MSGIRAKLLAQYAVLLATGPALGVVFTNGLDAPEAELLAAKRWHVGRGQLLVVPWDECPYDSQVACVLREAERWTAEYARITRLQVALDSR